MEFKGKLYEKYSQCQKYLIPKEVYYKTIEDLKAVTVLTCGDVEKFIKKRKSPEECPVYYATIKDTYNIISKAHILTGHGGCDRMLKHFGQKYANITTEAVE